MTKIECMQKMIKIWRYLQKHPEINLKIIAYDHCDLLEDLNDCPCCEYVAQFPYIKRISSIAKVELSTINCALCPLINLWKGEKTNLWKGARLSCMRTLSPYTRWGLTDLKERQMAAKEIADYSEQLLQKLLKENAK